MSIHLVAAESPLHWRQARQFVEEYATSLGVDLSFQNFVGCIGLRRFADGVGEIKRLYVSPAGRGHGVGKLLVEAVLAAGRQLGYARLVLDTLPSMKAAQKLYASFGFTPTAAYRFNPVPGTAYLEKVLG